MRSKIYLQDNPASVYTRCNLRLYNTLPPCRQKKRDHPGGCGEGSVPAAAAAPVATAVKVAAGLHRAGFVDTEGAAFEDGLVQAVQCCLCLFGGAHLNKSESFLLDNLHTDNVTIL